MEGGAPQARAPCQVSQGTLPLHQPPQTPRWGASCESVGHPRQSAGPAGAPTTDETAFEKLLKNAIFSHRQRWSMCAEGAGGPPPLQPCLPHSAQQRDLGGGGCWARPPDQGQEGKRQGASWAGGPAWARLPRICPCVSNYAQPRHARSVALPGAPLSPTHPRWVLSKRTIWRE